MVDNIMKQRLHDFMVNKSDSSYKTSWVNYIIISDNSKWKKTFNFGIVLLALYSTYSSTYL
jgi:hypothetical protein